MNKSRLLGLAIALFTPFFGQPAQAEMLVLGTASTGQAVTLDTDSVLRVPRGVGTGTNATYYLGDEKIVADIDCSQGYWTVDSDRSQPRIRYRPQSQATRNLLFLACGIRRINNQLEDAQDLLVYDPPSNVRSTPNGSVKCVIENMQIIRVVGEPRGTWYSTTACGGGWIDQSQIRPLR